MIAIATKRTVDLLELMTDLKIIAPDCYWPNAEGMITKKVLVKFLHTSRPISVFKNRIKRLYDSGDLSTKWILFSNTRSTIDNMYQSI